MVERRGGERREGIGEGRYRKIEVRGRKISLKKGVRFFRKSIGKALFVNCVLKCGIRQKTDLKIFLY